MNLTPAFIRKVLYFCAMIPPLVVIANLGKPAVRGTDGGVEQGGKLAQLRLDNNLSQASLGEIDPAGETMKLSTLGLRGVAVSELWRQAINFKKKKDFDRLSATVNQIVKLQPNFITVREFQAHNLSYNVSVEFDDYRDRYAWVVKGIEFLMDGTQYNRNEPHLMKECGWFVSQKIGRSDEFRQFRRLFRHDTDFHARLNQYVNVDDAKSRADLYPDNWLVGRLWYLKAERIVETRNVRTRENPWLFFSHAPRCLISYATALDRDGELPPEEVAQQAWRDAEKQWEVYGQREFYVNGEPTRLNMLPDLRAQCIVLKAAIDATASEMSPAEVEAVRTEAARLSAADPHLDRVQAKLRSSFPEYDRAGREIRQRKRKLLTQEQRIALDAEAERRTSEQHILAQRAAEEIEPTNDELLEAAPASQKPAVEKLIAEFREKDHERQLADQLDAHSKYHYWLVRCRMESTEQARAAKRHLFQARQLAAQAKLEKEVTLDENGKEIVTLGAKEHFEAAWDLWHDIFERRPEMYENLEESQMLLDDLLEYDRVLSKLDLPPLPHDFPLRGLIDIEPEMWEGRPIRPAPKEKKVEGESAPGSKPGEQNATAEDGKSNPGGKPADDAPAVDEPVEKKPGDDQPAEAAKRKAGDAALKPAEADAPKDDSPKDAPETPESQQPEAPKPKAQKPEPEKPRSTETGEEPSR